MPQRAPGVKLIRGSVSASVTAEPGKVGQLMAPVWLTVAAWVYLVVCFCSAAIVACDIAFNHRRQPMGVMNVVYPIAALFFGPFALALYWRWGRAAARTTMTSMPMSSAAAPQAAVAAAGGGMHRHGGRSAYDEMAGEGGPDGAGDPAAPGERAMPWCCSFNSNDALGDSARVQAWLEARFLLSERELRDG
jgi:hypothetical protein